MNRLTKSELHLLYIQSHRDDKDTQKETLLYHTMKQKIMH